MCALESAIHPVASPVCLLDSILAVYISGGDGVARNFSPICSSNQLLWELYKDSSLLPPAGNFSPPYWLSVALLKRSVAECISVFLGLALGLR